jgi:hypothetical protein
LLFLAVDAIADSSDRSLEKPLQLSELANAIESILGG